MKSKTKIILALVLLTLCVLPVLARSKYVMYTACLGRYKGEKCHWALLSTVSMGWSNDTVLFFRPVDRKEILQLNKTYGYTVDCMEYFDQEMDYCHYFHRLVAKDINGKLVFKGDDNTYYDPPVNRSQVEFVLFKQEIKNGNLS